MKINKGVFYVLLSAVLFSIGGLLIKLSTWNAITINGMRSVFGFITMYIILKKQGHKFVFNKVVLFGAVIVTTMNCTFVVATKLTSAGNAIVLQFTQPIFLILLIWIVYKHKPSKLALTTCFAVFFGIACFFIEQLSFDGMVGNIFAIVSGFAYALVLLMKTFDGMDFESSIMVSFLMSIAISIPWFVTEASYDYQNWILMILLGVFQMGLPFLFLGMGLNRVSIITASLTATIEPILNPILVAIFYHETLGIYSIIGGIIVVASSTIYNIIDAKMTKEKQSVSDEQPQ